MTEQEKLEESIDKSLNGGCEVGVENHQKADLFMDYRRMSVLYVCSVGPDKQFLCKRFRCTMTGACRYWNHVTLECIEHRKDDVDKGLV